MPLFFIGCEGPLGSEFRVHYLQMLFWCFFPGVPDEYSVLLQEEELATLSDQPYEQVSDKIKD
jgi:hypothetical protein